MSKSIFLILFLIISLTSKAQIKVERSDAASEFYTFYDPQDTLQLKNAAHHFDSVFSDTNQYLVVDSVFEDFSRNKKLVVDNTIKQKIKSEFIGFYALLSFVINDLSYDAFIGSESFGNQPKKEELILKAGVIALKSHLSSFPAKEYARLEKIWIDTLFEDSYEFYELLVSKSYEEPASADSVGLAPEDDEWETVENGVPTEDDEGETVEDGVPTEDDEWETVENGVPTEDDEWESENVGGNIWTAEAEYWNSIFSTNLISDYGYLEIIVNHPESCSLTINKQKREEKTNIKLVVPIESKSDVNIVISKEGYKSYSIKKKLYTGKWTTVSTSLKKVNK